MSGGSFWTMLRIAGFFAAIWFGGKVAKQVRVSSIVFEILVGLLFAPGLLPVDLLPRTYSVCNHDAYTVFGVETHVSMDFCAASGVQDALEDPARNHPLFHMIHHMHVCHDEDLEWERLGFEDTKGKDILGFKETEGKLAKCMKKHCKKEVAHLCGAEPNIFSLIGHAGVGLMIFESGMHFDFDGCSKVLPKAMLVAVFGTFLPVIAGTLLTGAFGYAMYPEGLAVGVALAPTSVGIALKLLLEAKALKRDFGQLIVSAAFIDDILSLIIFNVLFSVTSPAGFQVITCVVFPVVGIVFMLSFGSLGIFFWPKVIHWMKGKLKTERSFNEAMMCLMFFLLLSYGSFTMYLGTHLWGAFVAGMSFAGVHEAHHIWSSQTKRITAWMLRIFFSCTVAFAIPFQSLFTLEAFCYGSIMGIVACIATKVVSGLTMGKAKFVIGWAMVGRAEFAYLIAEMAKSGGILGDEMFAIAVWALLYATIIAPIVFKKVLSGFLLAELCEDGVDVETATQQTRRMARARTLHGGMPDMVVEEENLAHIAEHEQCSILAAQIATQDQEIADLKNALAVMEKSDKTEVCDNQVEI